MKRILYIALTCLLICSLSGCKNHGLRPDDVQIIADTTNSKCVDSYRAQPDGRTYLFAGGTFDFEVTVLPQYGTASPQYTLRNLYYQSMYQWKMSELQATCEKYGYVLCNDITMLNENDQCLVNESALNNAITCKAYVCIADFALYNPDLPAGYTEFQFYTQDATQTENIKACAQEMIDILRPHFLTNPHNMFHHYFSVYKCGVTDNNGQLTSDFEKLTSGFLYLSE